VSAAIRFQEVQVGYEIPPLAKVVTRKDVKAYADASGDQNPLHQSDEFARAAGFPGIIAHGMFTMAHLAQCLTNWLGDPTALVRLGVQFRAPVFMNEVIVAGGRVRELDSATRTAVLDLWVKVERDGATEYPIRGSEAEVRLA
jgi:acyl dehydratase